MAWCCLSQIYYQREKQSSDPAAPRPGPCSQAPGESPQLGRVQGLCPTADQLWPHPQRTARADTGVGSWQAMWNNITSCSLWRLSPRFMASRIQTLTPLFIRNYKDFCKNRQTIWTLRNSLCQVMKKTVLTLKCNTISHRFLSNKARYRQYTKTFPVLDGSIPSVCEHVFEENLRNSEACIQRYSELLCKVSKGGGENAILRHTQRNKKLLVRERLRMLLDDEPFLELSPFAGFDLPYGDVPAAGCLTGIGKIRGVWCVFMANDATVKGGTIYPISVKKQLRAQQIAVQNRLLSVYLVDSGGAFLPLQAELFPDQSHGGRVFYNEAIMSAMKIPQVAVVCGSCTAGGAYVPTMAEETVIVDKIGSMFLAGPPLVKAATGEDISPEDLGGASMHSKVSGCVDHFASSEKEAYECVRNIILTLNYELPPEETLEYDDPLYSAEELLGLAPRGYSYTLHIKPGSHFVQLCSQRSIPILFLQNTAPHAPEPTSLSQAEDHTNRLKAQASMMAAVACAAVPKITLVIGGCYGNESYAMCGRSFDPNFLFLWPNARVALVDSRHISTFPQARDDDCTGDDSELMHLKEKLEEESSAFHSSARLWDDGIILPQNSRKVIAQCLTIMKQQKYQIVSLQHNPVIRL
ncbi:methylcrotonoyl-CoA carboxylase beta chain, mitochondrial-like isoform X4 [Gopherus flavomarginatus]|uniref:methylcrotonoyl-CoA carboxylase beta chain, mitochondrial-like isoform X4 n=1 Tax=Gopherus flavomarginatus TaxID=286002 RepID=UPI0021CBF2C6|nr:methylcrotonoyl-CoA carboxylase beta chain, mitochondrial-like isoform X4 [Gopherus flavomarginatus]